MRLDFHIAANPSNGRQAPSDSPEKTCHELA